MDKLELIDLKKYKLKHIGDGTDGDVFKGTRNGKTVALKVIKESNSDMLKYVIKEIDLMKKISYGTHCHPNILCYHGIFKDKTSGKIVIISDFIEGIDLDKFINCQMSAKYFISVEQLEKFMISLLETVKFLHSKGIYHKDIKPANVMFSKNKLILIDFGLACTKSTCDPEMGTELYLPPYIQDENLEYYDIWALGCLFYDLSNIETCNWIYGVKDKFRFHGDALLKMRELKREQPQDKEKIKRLKSTIDHIKIKDCPMPLSILPNKRLGKIISLCFTTDYKNSLSADNLLKLLKNKTDLDTIDLPDNVLNNYKLTPPYSLRTKQYLTLIKGSKCTFTNEFGEEKIVKLHKSEMFQLENDEIKDLNALPTSSRLVLRMPKNIPITKNIYYIVEYFDRDVEYVYVAIGFDKNHIVIT